MARVLEFCKLALTENNPDSVLLNAAGTGKRSGVSGKKKPGQENHHLEKREGAWYFRYRYRGKQIYRRASKYITEARVKRDQWLDEFEKCGEFRDRIAEESPVKFKEIALAWCRKHPYQPRASTWRDWNGKYAPAPVPGRYAAGGNNGCGD